MIQPEINNQEILDLNREFKDYGRKWKSNKYRRWIRDKKLCAFCMLPLRGEKEAFETHHHKHVRKNDGFFIPTCLMCHNKFHAGEDKFKLRHGMTDEDLNKKAAFCLVTYLLDGGFFNAVINRLTEIAEVMEG